MAEVMWMDEDGHRVDDPADATFGEIDRGDGRRIYVDPADWAIDGDVQPMGSRPDNPNDPWLGADWIKAGTWDIRTADLRIVTTLAQLLTSLGLDGAAIESQVTQVEAFVVLPVWIPAPMQLRREVTAWLRENGSDV